MADQSSCGKRKRSKSGKGKRSKARIGQYRKGQHNKAKVQGAEQPNDVANQLNIPSDWLDVSGTNSDILLCQVTYNKSEHCPPLVVTRSLIVYNTSKKWEVHINGHLLDPSKIKSLADISHTVDAGAVRLILERLGLLFTCPGNPDEQYVLLAKSRKNGQFLSHKKELMAFLDSNACVTEEGKKFAATVRSSKCLLLINGEPTKRCLECSSYRNTLKALCHKRRIANNTNFSHTTFRNMKTPQKLAALRKMKISIRIHEKRIRKMKAQLSESSMTNGIELSKELEDEVRESIKVHSDDISALPQSDFRRIFWEQQVSASKSKTKKAIKWHPIFVRWCLNISRVSPKAYEILRESGVQLPTRRTLNDYTHWLHAEPGFHNAIDNLLATESNIKNLEEWQRYVILIFDEMKIKQDLVYDKTGKFLHGFVNLGDINTQLQSLEDDISNGKVHDYVATDMLTLMVRGIFFKLEYPYASFPTKGITADKLYWIVWEAVRRLEESNLKVIAFVCDGAKPNRKFLNGLGIPDEMKEGVYYKTPNRYSLDRFIYFISDVPHLIKTTRNCWFSSKSGGTRYMTINGKYILWEHLLALYDYKQSNSGLFLGHHLTYDHLHLTSYSKMKVNLAAQVLSNSVKCGFEMMNNDEYTETARFCHMFDRFFDCLNTRHFGEGRNKRKPDLEPYCTINDARLEWLECEFLGYLKEWENYTEVQNDLTKEEKNKMMLSHETRQGLKITVLAFVEMTRFLLTQKNGSFLLSERFSQDPLESHFGQQRARGGSNDNPNSRTFLYNTQAIRIQSTLAIGTSGGNVRKQKRPLSIDNYDELNRPLCKRPRRKIKF